MWAARPHLGSIFEKLLHRKTFYSPAARCLQSCDFDAMFHVKHCSSGRRSFASGKRRFHPCFCLPACCNCPVALSELATLMLMIQLCLNLKVLKHAIAAGKTYCKYNLLRKCGLLAHTSAAFLKNCCTEKLFICLRLGSRNQSCTLPLFAENTALSCNLLEIMVQ